MTAWAKIQARIMNNLKDAKQIITDKSGHSIQHTEPELIINAVKELIEINRKIL
jgi:pimeloyl-ACP methyl ester carboxylesterase